MLTVAAAQLSRAPVVSLELAQNKKKGRQLDTEYRLRMLIIVSSKRAELEQHSVQDGPQ